MSAVIASGVNFGLTYVLLPVLVAALTAVVTMWVTRAGEAANERRDRYAQSIATLVAWIEFPYRVRRRTSDDSSTLAELAAIGHDLQERLALNQAWISTDSADLADAYVKARVDLAEHVSAALREAWTLPPISEASSMNLGGWGPARSCDLIVKELQGQISAHFGVQRFKNAVGIKWRRKTSVSS